MKVLITPNCITTKVSGQLSSSWHRWNTLYMFDKIISKYVFLNCWRYDLFHWGVIFTSSKWMDSCYEVWVRLNAVNQDWLIDLPFCRKQIGNKWVLQVKNAVRYLLTNISTSVMKCYIAKSEGIDYKRLFLHLWDSFLFCLY